MNDLEYVRTDKAPAALGPYSQAVVADGWVFCAGQIPLVPETGQLVAGGISEQTERVLSNLAAVLAAAGSTLGEVLKTTVFLADFGDFAAMNEVYARHFGERRPARSTVEVAALPGGCLLEIECVARVRVEVP
jgi:2-iminobutanoate/2-iminopropanoate deaminase